MVPALAALGALTQRTFGFELRSIGFLPALVALTLYALLPILRNTRGRDRRRRAGARRGRARSRHDRDARCCGASTLPLAMPVIVAGLRTAAVWVVGTATLSTPVGATSLGNFIFSGLQTRNYVAVGVGCAAAAALALLLDQPIRALEAGLRDGRRVAGRRRARRLLACLCAWAAVGFAAPAAGLAARPIVIGAKTFTEQYVLSELLAARIADATGLPTRTLPSLGSTVAFDALRSNEIDVYVDYSGTVWATLMQRTQLPADRTRVLAEVADFLRAEHAIRVAAALGFENTYALGMRADARASRSAIAAHQPARLARPAARDRRRLRVLPASGVDGARSASTACAFRRRAQHGLVLDVPGRGARRSGRDHRLLDRRPDRARRTSRCSRTTAARSRPTTRSCWWARARRASSREVLAALASLAGTIDADQMRRMNLAVDQGSRPPAEVAREFLASLPGH